MLEEKNIKYAFFFEPNIFNYKKKSDYIYKKILITETIKPLRFRLQILSN